MLQESKMPKKVDHLKARDELAKLEPDALKAVTIRLPARLLRTVHALAEEMSQDLTATIRGLIAHGQEAAARPGEQVSAAVRKAVRKWQKPVELALLAGRSPIEPFLAKEVSDQELKALAFILGGLDFQTIFTEVRRKTEARETYIDRFWNRLKDEASDPLRELMSGLDHLEELFLARKKLRSFEGPDGQESRVYWLIADQVMAQLGDPSSDNADVEKLRKLISARFMFVEDPSRAWRFVWDE